ncbi:CRISPR-associated endoribonuclease Cas6 [Vallitalea pronyensis]|uniref:CRISPR-associated endoribonuclease n=1 Tax=Vallitalea pronyensis TaxID=1348613 RepID=A0A8J8SHL6_9FIRM|nr:CRISPR-associated endoribonuclease Cas6 [Vallitalea pronyensis]QUI23980.1 CRISPR-associated endoribonuclease Cas6 [Vallitalea pronyensis]
MRVYITFESDKPITLPLQYNHIVQAVILNYLGNESYQEFLHNEGFQYEKRKFKMYTFSRLFGQFIVNKRDKRIVYNKEIHLVIASMDPRLTTCFLNTAFMKENIQFGQNEVRIKEVRIDQSKVTSPLRVYTKSPITIYSTLTHGDKKKTYYYSPYEPEFEPMLRDNLIKKYIALNGKQPEDTQFVITPLNKKRLKERIILYKGFIIKGWDGGFLLEGSEALLNLAYHGGVGNKNAQGLGCLEIMKN